MTREINVVVPDALAGVRADDAIARLVPVLTRRKVQGLCEARCVSCRGRPLKKSTPLVAGETVRIQMDPPERATPNAAAPLFVRFESRHWVIVAKPAGQPTAPKNPAEVTALANALLGAYPELSAFGHGPLEPGLLHRLDNGTSGLIVAARTRASFLAATEALRRGEWTKRYLACVQGSDLPVAGFLAARVAADRHRPRRVRLASSLVVQELANDEWLTASTPLDEPGSAMPHVTRFRVMGSTENVSLVEVSVGTAMRHQIRAHFAAAGWPLVNDETYGATREPRLESGRHALHAARVAWSGTDGFEAFDAFEPLPRDLFEFAREHGLEPK